MSAERWAAVERLYHAALSRPIDERVAFLAEACAGDEELRREVESLLAQEASADGVLTQGGVVAAAGLVTDVGQSVLAGRRLGSYQILAPLGAGGMGEVYRARDTRLGRDVAIKILPRAFTADAGRLARFEREARVLASLNHPHIAAIYGIEEGPAEAGSHKALILELVDGETLAERITRAGSTGLPVNEALDIARQIADALDAAHEKGIVHRDLKPANIKITAQGIVKVLDFGLAKLEASGAGQAGGEFTDAPTITVNDTREGLIVGTAAYMSPEQARGQVVDKRTDIWAFGCVLYEMLTGRAPFARATIADTISALVEHQPDWSLLSSAPQGIRRLLRWCLEKDPKNRLRDAADARLQIEEAIIEPSSATTSGASAPLFSGWHLTSLIVAVATSVAVASYVSRSRPELPETRLDITTPPTTDPVSLAISPDGLKVAFSATVDGQTRLWVRPLDSVEAQPLAGTDGAAFPFWSPDSRSIAFFAERQLKRIDVGRGTIQVLASAEGGRGGAWAVDGTILFQPTPGVGPLFAISASGGQAKATATEYGRFPQFLADSRHFLYFRPGPPQIRGLYVSELGSGNGERILQTEAAAVYASSGHLLFVRQGTLLAQPFDAETFKLTGEPIAVATALVVNGPLLSAPVSASVAGPIVYRARSAGGLRQFVWFDRAGKSLGKVGDAVENLLQPEITLDGRRVALHRLVDANTDLWSLDVNRGVLTRFTSSPFVESSPVWAPDGTRIAFSSNQTGAGDLYVKTSGGDGREEVILETPREKWPTDWSRDGRFLLYVERGNVTTGRDLWVLPLTDRRPFVIAQTPADEEDGQFSPDVKWVAYQSNESGRMEVYVSPLGGPGDKIQVSIAGGAQARWRGDGKELYYVALDGRMMAVPITAGASGMEAGSPSPLFAAHVGDPLQTNMRRAYVVSGDGQRFLIDTLVETDVAPITVLLNWKPRS